MLVIDGDEEFRLEDLASKARKALKKLDGDVRAALIKLCYGNVRAADWLTNENS